MRSPRGLADSVVDLETYQRSLIYPCHRRRARRRLSIGHIRMDKAEILSKRVMILDRVRQVGIRIVKAARDLLIRAEIMATQGDQSLPYDLPEEHRSRRRVLSVPIETSSEDPQDLSVEAHHLLIASSESVLTRSKWRWTLKAQTTISQTRVVHLQPYQHTHNLRLNLLAKLSMHSIFRPSTLATTTVGTS